MNKKLWLILIIALLNAAGLTIVIPLFPFLIGLYVPAEKIALYLGVLVSIYAVCKFFMAPIMGALSDYFGRKPILFSAPNIGAWSGGTATGENPSAPTNLQAIVN